ncbi:hypothetical protein BS47DRAFT_1361557 [Hydnum rufescens UP504]|uniref:Uncharacterized protein n=1 Tax=Hydnum rufescens UP504 TaxID=1448309 RepID=A0A9P6B1M1_9AGAM|nr:hypothetical protein BS47DRAFT_1361557 [Hydnum rufescens UP504]
MSLNWPFPLCPSAGLTATVIATSSSLQCGEVCSLKPLAVESTGSGPDPYCFFKTGFGAEEYIVRRYFRCRKRACGLIHNTGCKKIQLAAVLVHSLCGVRYPVYLLLFSRGVPRDDDVVITVAVRSALGHNFRKHSIPLRRGSGIVQPV